MAHIRVIRKSAARVARSSLSTARRSVRPFYIRLMDVLTDHFFPRVVTVMTYPGVILATMLLIVPLIMYADRVQWVLIGNTYLNVASASVSMIVLYQSLHHHREAKRLNEQSQSERLRIQQAHADDITEVRRLVQHLANYTAALREDVGRLERAQSEQSASVAPPVAKARPRRAKKSQFDPIDPIVEE
jgi:hypothetical protein